ncbi:MAG: GNAT family N-acetyltransferase [Bacteroidetes bacterium]|nr:GNAT family N-acetyltransferase [Bacteroidota bacterium]MBL7103869.1 GNAT family N-acetyltransferase [Bacteroidales bacterium]
MLKGKNIKLRALEPTDVDILYHWENDDKIWHLSNTVTPFSKFDLEQYVISSQQDIFTTKQLRLMIDKIDKGNQKVTIGSIDLFDFDPANKRAGIGILIVKEERRKGYAAEALELLLEYCFKILHLHQVYCNITINNTASLNLFKKHNFKIIGKKNEWLHIKDKWMDEYVLQLIHYQA